MLEIESRFIEQINANPDDRATQLIYADWLDQQGDPRAEAWRVLIEDGRSPAYHESGSEYHGWNWGYGVSFIRRDNPQCLGEDLLGGCHWQGTWAEPAFPTFFSAMDAAAVAWVRCHRDPEFLRESMPA